MAGVGNKRPENHREVTKFFSKGADSVTDPELSGNYQDAKYVRSKNARPTSDEGSYSALERINGEELLYENEGEPNSEFKCICSTFVNKNLVEIWADKKETYNSKITVDGKIVLDSPNFLVNYRHPIDSDVNHNALGGELFITDYNIPPMIFNIQDMVDNISTDKYFGDFKKELYEVNLRFPVNILRFDSLVSVGAGGGLPTGQYSYSYRFVSESGETTAQSISTPLIFVPVKYNFSTGDDPFPYADRRGGDPNIEISQSYGIKLKLRVNNVFNYSYIELIRTSYNNGEGIGFQPQPYIVQRIEMSPGEFSVIEIIDSYTNETDNIPLGQIDSQNTLSVIKRAKAIRYFKNKLNLGNIEYESRDVDDNDFEFKKTVNGNVMYPVLELIGQEGHSNAYNHTYKKSLDHNEEYGWSILFWDENFQRSFASKIEGFESFRMPRKRDEMTPDSLDNSDLYTGIFAICQLQASVLKRSAYTYETVTKFGGNNSGVGGLTDIRTIGSEDVQINIGNSNKGIGGRPTGENAGYKPRTPAFVGDNRNNRNIKPVEEVTTIFGSETENSIPTYQENWSMGMGLAGLIKFPSWAKAFSIARTKRANRIVAQGMGFYSMIEAELVTLSADVKWLDEPKKKLDELSCHFPDIENGIVSVAIIEDMLNNPSNYKLELVEPLGFNNEIYHSGHHPNDPIKAENVAQTQVDQIVYANVQAGKLPDEAFSPGIEAENYTSFGKWRNSVVPPAIATSGGNYTFDIVDIEVDTSNEENKTYFKIRLSDNIYSTGVFPDRAPLASFNNPLTAEFHEPVYIVNIIREGASVPDKSYSEYLINGNYIKLESIVGYGTGEDVQEFEIVDERPDDFNRTSAADITQNYVYVTDIDGNEKRYININFMSPVQISAISLDIVNETTLFNGDRLYGMFTSDETKITFNSIYGASFLPQEGETITVKYNSERPIRVFGGDTVIGSSLFPLIHRKCKNGGIDDHRDIEQDANEGFKLGMGFPYREHYLAPNIYKVMMTNADEFYTVTKCTSDIARQLVIYYTIQSRSHLPLSYGSYFPKVNYIERPAGWFPNDMAASKAKIFDEYFEDYPDEELRWRLGGFQLEQFPFNIDYSKEQVHELIFSRPQFLFEGSTLFKNRVIWSATRPIQISQTPNLKTFSPYSYKDISDKHGEIKKLFDSTTGSGDNLYAFCEKDICLLLTNKRTLNDGSGGTLGYTEDSDSDFISQEVWLNVRENDVLTDNFEFSFAENGKEAFFINKEGVFKFFNNSLQRIDRMYKNRTLELLRSSVNQNDDKTSFTGFYEPRYNEYWVQRQYLPREIVASKYSEEILFGGLLTVREAILYDLTRVDAGSIFSVFDSNFAEVDFEPTATIYSVHSIELTSLKSGFWYFRNDIKSDIIEFSLNIIVNDEILVNIPKGQAVYVEYDEETREWSAEVINSDDVPIIKYLFVYCNEQDIESYISEFDYCFDRYASLDNRTYGSKDLKTYELHKGNKINGENIEFEVLDTINPEDESVYKDKEFIRMQANTNDVIPDSFEVLDSSENVISRLTGSNMKKYGGYGNYIPRNPDTRKRIQGVYITYRISYKGEERIVLKSVSIQYKILK